MATHHALFETVTIPRAIIYCDPRSTFDSIKAELVRRGVIVSTMHADLADPERDSILRECFARLPSVDVLVSTECLPLGFDVPPHVPGGLICIGLAGGPAGRALRSTW